MSEIIKGLLSCVESVTHFCHGMETLPEDQIEVVLDDALLKLVGKTTEDLEEKIPPPRKIKVIDDLNKNPKVVELLPKDGKGHQMYISSLLYPHKDD